MCLYPRLIKNRKYTMNKKNEGNIPPVIDQRTLLVPVGCGNCIECRKQKSREWQIRMLEDIKHNKNGKMVTLTFNNKSIIELRKEIKRLTGYNLDNAIATLAVRRWLERWRKKYKKSLRHWLVTEIGHNGTENIHMHGIIWTDEPLETVEKIWKYGWMWKGKEENGKMVNYVSQRTINYIIKYVSKRDEKHKHYKSIILTSDGIGKEYLKQHNSTRNKYKGEDTNQTYRTNTGHKISLPIYWRNKIYTEEQREQLWLQRLNKQEMWVMGEKVDVSQGYETYDKLQKYYRRINIQFGYGNEEKTEAWYERRRYENERRKIMLETRMKDPYGTKKKAANKRKEIEEYFGTKNIIKQME